MVLCEYFHFFFSYNSCNEQFSYVIAYVAILIGVAFISSHVLKVKWVMISLLPKERYNSLIHYQMKLSSNCFRYFSTIFDALVFFSAYNVSYILYVTANMKRGLI